jgi:hypothetical protein
MNGAVKTQSDGDEDEEEVTSNSRKRLADADDSALHEDEKQKLESRRFVVLSLVLLLFAFWRFLSARKEDGRLTKATYCVDLLPHPKVLLFLSLTGRTTGNAQRKRVSDPKNWWPIYKRKSKN